jgi:hypothetical protein
MMGRANRLTGSSAALLMALMVLAGCRSAAPTLDATDLEAARLRLSRPLPGSPVALYHLRVPSSGGLRLSLLTSGEAGRLTISEPFGSAVSMTAWVGAGPATFFDLRQGCRLEAVDLERVLGISAMPLPQAVRLLAGRLPAADGDRVSIRSDGRLLVEGAGWKAVIEVASEPWRVMSVAEERAGGGGWKIELSDHTASVPGVVHVKQKNGRWAELELVRLEWKTTDELPLLPELPVCVPARSSHRVSTTDGESRRPAVPVSNRAPRRSPTTTASPDS